MNGDVVPIFAVPLYKANIGLIETEKEYLMGDKSWVGGGTHLIQSQEDDILEKKECSRISKEIKYHLSHYLNTVISPKYEDVTLCITQSWINIITDGFHHTHRHQNSMISGVYYINVTSRDHLSFQNPMSPFSDPLSLAPRNESMYNSSSYKVNPKVGDLILFPSWLSHGVNRDPLDFTSVRCSLSFNTFPLGRLSGSHVNHDGVNTSKMLNNSKIVLGQGDVNESRQLGDFVLESYNAS